jgi:hypothetical protein
MRSAAAVVLSLSLVAACDWKPRRPLVGRVADSAVAEAPKVVEAAKPPPPMTLRVSGAQHFTGDSGFTVSCVASESGGEKLMQVEGMVRGAHVSFTIYNAREGKVPVGNKYTRSRAKTRIGNLEVFVGSRGFADGGGSATLTDPYGRAGAISASNFIKMGAKKKESHRASLSVRLRWSCG